MGQPSEFAEFHAWATNEAAALLNSSAEGRSEAVVRELDTVRKALETAARSIAEVMTAPVQAAEIDGFVEHLTAQAGLDTMRTQLRERDATNRHFSELLKNARAELETVGQEVKSERARADAACADAAQMRAEFECTLDDLRREHAAVLGEQARTYTSLPLDGLLTVFHDFANATTITEVVATLVDGIAREFSRIALFEVRNGGLQCTRQVGFDFQRDVSKVVVPLLGDSLLTRCVKSGRLEGFFAGPHSDASTVIPFGGTPACALAIPIVVHNTTVVVIYADDSDGAGFSDGAPQARAKFAELLHHHALLVLVRICGEQTPQPQLTQTWQAAIESMAPVKARQSPPSEVRDLVFKLTDQLESDYTANAEVGRNRVECQQRLKERLERSRRLYADRVVRDDPNAANFLDEHLRAVARARNTTSFGRDLAALVS